MDGFSGGLEGQQLYVVGTWIVVWNVVGGSEH